MIFNSALEEYLRNTLERKKFESELEDLEHRNPISIEIIPVDLLFMISQMQAVYKSKITPQEKEDRKEIRRICKHLEETLEMPPTIKKKVDEKWEELGIQDLDSK